MRAGAWTTGAQRRAARDLMREIRSRHPDSREAIGADLRISAANRDERSDFRSRWDELAAAVRLAWISDAFFAQVLYRVKASLQRRGVPVLPRLAHRLAMSIAQVCIGDPVVIHPGVYIVHGQVVIDGFVEVHPGVVISPFVTIGVRGGGFASPTIGRNVEIGTGAKILGGITVGEGAKIGANAVVLDDVPPGATVVGVPARVVRSPGPRA